MVTKAGSYGAPQTRRRFFLIASKATLPLPRFPAPSHAFPAQKFERMSIVDGAGRQVQLSCIEKGIAPHRHITIEDAIGDLWPFDWYLVSSTIPHFYIEPICRCLGDEPRTSSRWPLVRCQDGMPFYGPPFTPSEYYHEATNTFQEQCRARPSEDLQHFTARYPESTVERYVLAVLLPHHRIPSLTCTYSIRAILVDLQPGADFSSLPRGQLSHGMAHPQSSTAKHGFRKGLPY